MSQPPAPPQRACGRPRQRLAGNGPPPRPAGTPNRAERRALIRRTCRFPNLYDRPAALPAGDWSAAA